MKKATKTEREESAAKLRTILTKPGVKVYATVKAISRSGMSRSITFRAFWADGGEVNDAWLDRSICKVLRGVTFDEKREAVKVSGCGMDMAFHVLYEACHAVGVPDDVSQHYRRF